MTREELIEMLNILLDNAEIGCADITVIKHVSFDSFKFVLVQTIKALLQESSRNMEEIAEIMKCDADAETKCKMISNILTAKSHYFEEQEPMREFTTEEATAYSKALDKMYKPTGFNVFNEPCNVCRNKQTSICGNCKHYDEFEKEPCNDAISRQATLKPYEGLEENDTVSVWLVRKNIEQQSSVIPTCEEREKGECPWYAGCCDKPNT